ncbi:MAG: hypothetical protein DDT20_01461 [Firmicutes bacterium]|nr:hypothetical protein [Bacillota bacterium]
MDVYDIIRGRRSVRQYTADRVPKALAMKVLEAAAWAPSGRNQQPSAVPRRDPGLSSIVVWVE